MTRRQRLARRLPKARAQKFTEAQVAKALTDACGVRNWAAQLLSEMTGHTCDRSTISARIKASPTLQAIVQEAEEEGLDIAEHAVMKKIKEGDAHLALRFLELKAKTRGYSRQVDLNANINANVQIQVTDARRRFYEELDEMAARRRLVASRRAVGDELGETGSVPPQTRH